MRGGERESCSDRVLRVPISHIGTVPTVLLSKRLISLAVPSVPTVPTFFDRTPIFRCPESVVLHYLTLSDKAAAACAYTIGNGRDSRDSN